MPLHEVTLESTTDTKEQVLAALGITEPPPAEPATPPETPPEPPAAAATAAPETQEVDPETGEPVSPPPAAPAAGPPPAVQAKPKSKAELRIGELTRERHDADRRADEALRLAQAAQERAERLGAELDAAKRPPEPASTEPELVVKPKPKQEDFDDWGAYVEALTDWKTDQAITPLKQEFGQAVEQRLEYERQQYVIVAQQGQFIASMNRVEQEGRTRHADFDAVIDQAKAQGIKWSPYVSHIIQTHPHGADLAYELAKDLDASARFSAITSRREWIPNAAVEVGLYLAQVIAKHPQPANGPIASTAAVPENGAPKTTAPPAPARVQVPISSAPPPYQPLKPSSTTTPVTAEDFIARGDARGYMDWRKAQERARSGR